MIPLTIIADPLGGWLALAFILVFIVKVILSAFGGDVDADFGADGDVDVDVNTDGFGFSASDFFSLKGFLNFGVGFCSSWALFGLDKWWNVGLAIVVGLITMFLLVLAYRACMKLEGTNTNEAPKDLLYRIGTIYTTTNSAVILQIKANGRIDELVTVPDEGYSPSDFKTGELAFISKVESPTETSIRFYAKPYEAIAEDGSYGAILPYEAIVEDGPYDAIPEDGDEISE